jgi:hypothetical protein
MTRRTGKTAALALAAAAVVAVSAGGGAVAQTLITGQQIKDGTVTGADLKNGTIRSADVGDGSVTGTDVKNGSIASADVAGGYYTKAEIDARFQTSGSINLPGYAFTGSSADSSADGCVFLGSGTSALASVQIPTGVTITGFTARVIDLNIDRTVTVRLFREGALLAEASTGNFFFGPQSIGGTVEPGETITGQESVYLMYTPTEAGAQFGLKICSVSVDYSMP